MTWKPLKALIAGLIGPVGNVIAWLLGLVFLVIRFPIPMAVIAFVGWLIWSGNLRTNMTTKPMTHFRKLLIAGCAAMALAGPACGQQINGMLYGSAVRPYESQIVITTDHTQDVSSFMPGEMVVWYKVTNNSATDFSYIDFMCDVYKKDGSFFESVMQSVKNVKHGQAEYSEQDLILDFNQFGHGICRLTELNL